MPPGQRSTRGDLRIAPARARPPRAIQRPYSVTTTCTGADSAR